MVTERRELALERYHEAYKVPILKNKLRSGNLLKGEEVSEMEVDEKK